MEPDNSHSRPEHKLAALDAMQARDTGLRLLSRANRWLISAAVLAAAGLTALTDHAFHASRARAATPPPATSSASTGQSAAPSGDDSASLQAPSSAPVQSAPAPVAPAPVVSGGS